MDKIKQWTLVLSAVSVLSGLILAIIPHSASKKLFKTIVTVVLIYMALQPIIGIKGVDFNIDDYLKDNYSTGEKTDKYAISAMISSAEKAIENLLTENSETAGLNYIFECRCYEAGGEIKVEKIYISPKPPEADMPEIKRIIKSLGFDESMIAYKGESDGY